MGPHPPPPLASRNPLVIPRRPSPTRVRGARRAVSRCFSSFVFDACLALERKIERKSSHNPSRSRKLVTTGSAAAVEILESTVAPRKAPIAPGTPRAKTVGQ